MKRSELDYEMSVVVESALFLQVSLGAPPPCLTAACAIP